MLVWDFIGVSSRAKTMIPEKDPERENSYDDSNGVAGENCQDETGFIAKLVSLFRF